ncbi:protein TASOR isoform X2 [Ranitomeya imitator]|uniref:protein TASOR isoform X2 n=1 Tax=Ranitomeya imitator TaxID=111125 RepID=UPI0037E896A3
MFNGVGEKEAAEAMEEEKLGAVNMDVNGGGGNNRLAAAEDTRLCGSQNGEAEEDEAAAAAEKTGCKRRNSVATSEAANMEGVRGGSTPTEEPPRKRFQIPKKSREKKALQPINSGSWDFEEVLRILQSSYLDANSKMHFTYQSARMVHNEFLEKEFTEKRRQLKFEGRSDKELVESYAFLLVDEDQVQTISEKGLLVGNSKFTTLGKSSMGVYLSKCADLLQVNPLEVGTTGSIAIFKVIKGKMKAVYDNFRNNQESFSGATILDPAPKHECHVLKNMNAVTTLLSYRAFERSQYYFYEYGFDEILKRPRHVCPYAVVSFLYKAAQKPRRPSSPLPGEKKILHSRKFDGFEEEVVCRRSHVWPVNVSVDHYNDRSSFILWRGQLLSKGRLLCLASLKSTSGPFFPYKLPDKLDLDIVMRLEQIKRRIPPLLFFKESHSRCREVLKGGIYSRLYEVSNKTKTGKELQSLLQKLEKEKLALVKPLADGGFLLFFFPTPMTASYGAQSTKSYPLHALFIYPESKETLQPASHFKSPSSPVPEGQEIIPERPIFVPALHYAILKSQTDTSDNFNVVVEKHVRFYLRQRAEGSHKHKDYVIRPYDQRLDLKKNLFVAPYDRTQIYPSLNSYLHGSEAYIISFERAKEIIAETRRVQQFSPVSDYEPMEDDHDLENTHKVADERLSEHTSYDQDRLKNLINLIQMKKIASNNTENSITSTSGLTTINTIENSPETEWNHTHENFLCDSDDAVDSAHCVSTLISELGGQDTDLREENSEMEADPTPLENYNELLEATLKSNLLESISKLFSVSGQLQATHEEIDKMEFSLPSDSINTELYEQSTYVQEQNVDLTPVIAPPEDDDYGEKDVVNDDLSVNEEIIQGPYSGYASPCPSTPTEELYSQQNSASGNIDSEMHWKLIPITGLRLIEDQSVYSSPQEDALPNDPRINHTRRCKGSGYSPLEVYRKGRRHSSRSDKGPYRDFRKKGHFKSKHCHDGLIEQTVVDVYSKFSEQLQEVLRAKDISFNAISTPLLSSEDRVVKLSEWISTQASEISVQQYVEDLRVKLDIIVNSRARPTDEFYESKENMGALEREPEGCGTAEYTPKVDISLTLKPGLDHNGCTEEASSDKELDTPPLGSPAPHIDTAPSTSQDGVVKNVEISDFLKIQLNREVFMNLTKIFAPENKILNMVKFYIHAELEENTLCAEIKDYLTKLGNIHCHPDQYVHESSAFNKLLIIIHNEDIEKNIHTIPSLTELKKRSCVSFAGVDSLDDLKNRTYNELFVSGGFIVPDDSVLNPDSVTAGKLEKFLLFLEQINTPEQKWQLKIHCKFQKKLKELGRTKPNALNMLALFNTYQKKHLVEILSYHYCDSQNRQAPELECLIKLQVQNIQQRHLIFLTEKKESLFLHYSDNGIVVTRMDEFMKNFTKLVGLPSSSSEGIFLPNMATEEKETVLGTADVKEEDDMSLDSADGSLEIELCANSANPKSERGGAATLSEAEDAKNEGVNPRSPIIDADYMQPVTPISTAGSTTGDNSSVTGDDLSFRDYSSKQLGISPFNLLTHQTFLGSGVYPPILGNQTSGENHFTNSFSQPTDQETAPHSEWDHKWNVK